MHDPSSLQKAIACATLAKPKIVAALHEHLEPRGVLAPIASVFVARSIPLALYHLASVSSNADFDRTALLSLRLLHVLHSGSSASTSSAVPRSPSAASHAAPLIGALVLSQIEDSVGPGAYEQLLLSFIEVPSIETLNHAAALLAMAACRASRGRLNMPGVDGVRRLCKVLASISDPRVVTHVLYSLLALSIDPKDQHDIALHSADVVLELLRIAPEVSRQSESSDENAKAVVSACVTAAKLFFNLSRNGSNRSVLYRAELRQHTAAFKKDMAKAATALGIRLPALLSSQSSIATSAPCLELKPVPAFSPDATFLTSDLQDETSRESDLAHSQSSAKRLGSSTTLGATAAAAGAQLVSTQRIALTALKTLSGDTVVLPGPMPGPAEAALLAQMSGSKLQSYVQSSAVAVARSRPTQSLPPRDINLHGSGPRRNALTPLTPYRLQASHSATALTVPINTSGVIERNNSTLHSVAEQTEMPDRPRTSLLAHLMSGGKSSGAVAGGSQQLSTSASAPSFRGVAPVTQAFVGSSREVQGGVGELQTRMAVSTLKSAGKARVVIREQTRLTAPTYYAEQSTSPLSSGGPVQRRPASGSAAAPDRWDPDVVACSVFHGSVAADDAARITPTQLPPASSTKAPGREHLHLLDVSGALLGASGGGPAPSDLSTAVADPFHGVDSWADDLRLAEGVGVIDDDEEEGLGPSGGSVSERHSSSAPGSHGGAAASKATAAPAPPPSVRFDTPFSVSLRGPDHTTRSFAFHVDKRTMDASAAGQGRPLPATSRTIATSRGEVGLAASGTVQLPGARGKAAESDSSLLSLSEKATLELLAAALARARGAPAASVRQVGPRGPPRPALS